MTNLIESSRNLIQVNVKDTSTKIPEFDHFQRKIKNRLGI